ncbi:MAG TPA: DUF6541 family protein [Candidatus Dormibacteraeota bacterium]|nr:DUF6541 family protein [Candidatus Dormibacteraeota bacterium]
MIALNVVLAGILPGWLLLRALAWPRSRPERLLMVVPASLAVLALAAALAGVAGAALSTAGIVALDLGLAAVAWLRRTALTGEETLPTGALVAGAIPGLLLLALVILGQGGLVVPPGADTVVHSQVVRWFMDGHAAPPLLPDHLAALDVAETRYGWHVLAAALVHGTGIDAARALTLGTWPVVLALPGSAMLLARRAGLGWRPVLLSGIACLGVGLVPFGPLSVGLTPQLTGAFVLAPAAAVAVVDGLRHRTVGACLCGVILTGSLLYVHPSDLPTEALLIGTLVVIGGLGRLRLSVRDLGAGAAAIAVLAAVSAPWFHYHDQALAGGRLGVATVDAAVLEGYGIHRPLSGVAADIVSAFSSWGHAFVLPALAIAALALGWRNRTVRGLGLLGAALLLLQADTRVWQQPVAVLHSIFPWSSPARLVLLDLLVLVPLAAIAVDGLVERLPAHRLTGTRRAGVAAALMGLAVAPVAVQMPGLLARASTSIPLSAADEAGLWRLSALVPARDVILTDGIADAGAFIPALTDRQVLVPKDWVLNSAAPAVQTALQQLCAEGSSARLQALGVRWVFLGSAAPATGGAADRSCRSGTRELRPVPLGVPGAAGPWVLEVRPSAAALTASSRGESGR